MSTTLRLGIVGMGNMGSHHAAALRPPIGETAIDNITLAAVCDASPERRAAADKFGVPAFASHTDLLASNTCDALLIATPHYHHVPIALDALAAGRHILVEKPLAVSITQARQLVAAAARHPHLVFGIMYNQRANPLYQKMRELVRSGAIGAISRITWIVTNWFRTHAYYASSPWRATWAGEGGGVLINQCPHNLDLLHHITGLLPTRVTAVGFVGKTHPIETEDEISAILEYPATESGPGAIGHFITSTGEFPGANRLEICGSRGKLLAENGVLTLSQTAVDIQDFNRTSPNPFGTPEITTTVIPLPTAALPEHQTILHNFAHAALNNHPTHTLLAPGPEAVYGLELGNAVLIAALTCNATILPIPEGVFDAFLEKMEREHAGRKSTASAGKAADLSQSFSK